MNLTPAPNLTRRYPAARQWTDAHLGDRLIAPSGTIHEKSRVPF